MPTLQSYIQVGMNPEEGVVKVRAPDGSSAGGYVVQRLAPVAARELARWLGDGTANKKLKITDGHRWAEHELSPATARKIAADLRGCADAVEGLS